MIRHMNLQSIGLFLNSIDTLFHCLCKVYHDDTECIQASDRLDSSNNFMLIRLIVNHVTSH